MISVSVKNLKLFEIVDASGSTYCGGWQEWYGRCWKRLAGCGPTVISGIVHYLNRSQTADAPDNAAPAQINEFQVLMEEIWHYVTPSVRGLPSPSALTKGARVYLDDKGLPYTLEELDVPKSRRTRPDFMQIVSFVHTALEADTPVAFLSLDKGAEDQLDNWHWVTILSLDYTPNGAAAKAGVADEGRYFQVDLRKWFDTTPLGGGFVRFMRRAK